MFNIKSIIKENRTVKMIASSLYRMLKRNTCKCYGHNNVVLTNVCGLFLSNSNIRIWGNDNKVIFTEGDGVTNFSNLNISIHGNNNLICIGANSSGSGLCLNTEDDNNQILLGGHFVVDQIPNWRPLKEQQSLLERIVC